MIRRWRVVTATTLMVLGSSLVLEPVSASNAVSIDATGWWWRAQSNESLLLPPPPGVGEDDLLVQGAPDEASAIAAIAATLPAGEANPVLTLNVVESSTAGADEAIVLACQAGSTWSAGGAQPWTKAPKAACEAGGVEGRRNPGGSWSFDLGSMQFGTRVNIVLVPGVVEGRPPESNGSTFSIAFKAPTVASIQSERGAPPLPPTRDPDPPDVDFEDLPDDDGFVAPTFDTPSYGGGGGSFAPVTPALPQEDQGLTKVAPVIQDRNPLLPASAYSNPRSEHAEAIGVILLLLGAAIIHNATRKPIIVGPEGIPGGLGQWSKPRWGSPPSLRG